MFSPMEEKILKILAGKRLTTGRVAAILFKNSKGAPIEPNVSVSKAVDRINKKCKFHKLKWYIDGEGLGRGGRTIWITKK